MNFQFATTEPGSNPPIVTPEHGLHIMINSVERLNNAIQIAEAQYFFNANSNAIGQKRALEALHVKLKAAKLLLADFKAAAQHPIPEDAARPAAGIY